VVDLETTGTTAEDEICEIGAVLCRGGETVGTFQTFVNPGRGIPPMITVLTGIGDVHVTHAPRIDQVLPSLLEFMNAAVTVGHNVSFDLGFLRRACERVERELPSATVVDTLGLSRRLVRDEVPNCKLSTLADHLRLGHRPSHRALDDALATTDLLHLLIERARGLGVTSLEELIELPTAAAHPMHSKLALTDRLPRAPGIYLFRDRSGTTLYVGKAANLRQRVRSYFSSDERKKTGTLLTRTARIDHRRTSGPLESEMLELRLIQALEPEFNQQGTDVRTLFVLASADHRTAKVTASTPRPDDLYLGPIASRSAARRVASALHTCVAVHEISEIGDIEPPGAQMPPMSSTSHAGMSPMEAAIRGDLQRAIDPMQRRMALAAGTQNFERAAAMRDEIAALIDARRRQARLAQLRRTRSLVIAHEGMEYRFRHGVLTHLRSTLPDGRLALDEPWQEVEAAPALPPPDEFYPIDGALAEQILVAARWWERVAGTARICFVDGELSSVLVDELTTRTASTAITSARGRIRGDRGRQRSGDSSSGSTRRMGGHSAITRASPRSA
jgi:DNA polymerase-3 subunit epsilon